MVQKKNTGHSVVAIGAGVAALAAASYYLFGPKGAQHRKKLQGWVIQMKGDVIREIENLKEVSEPIYQQVVEKVAKKYASQSTIAKADVDALVKEMKKHWRSIAGVKKTAQKAGKSGARGTVKKTKKA